MRLNSILICAIALLFLVSWWKRDELPFGLAPLPALAAEPSQRPTADAPFTARFNGVDYRIRPEFSYELTGLVVSFRHHDGNSRMHRRAGDHLNMLDVCVVWGENAVPQLLREFDFWNGIFTCNFKTRSREAWAAFDEAAVSNNHLISDDPLIRRQVREIRVGDQVRIRGHLASYGSDNASLRGTSTTRLDTGDGACETIFVDSFEILQEAPGHWRTSMWGSLMLLALALINHYRRPFRTHAVS